MKTINIPFCFILARSNVYKDVLKETNKQIKNIKRKFIIDPGFVSDNDETVVLSATQDHTKTVNTSLIAI